MAKHYGLIVPNKTKSIVKKIERPSVFDEDSDSDEVSNKPTGQRAVKKQDKITQHKAIEEDPTVYQYDEIYDEIDKKRKESKLSRKEGDRKPKYINKLLAAADRRKKENERRIERQVQKEREAEGDSFKDKEAFVTLSYKKKLEEMKEMEEQEKREEYLEGIGDVRKQGNLDGFYRHLYDQKVNYNDDVNKDQTDEKRKVRKYRKRRDSDDSQQEEEIKKEHLFSNLDADSDFTIDSSESDDEIIKENSIETASKNSPKKVEESKIEAKIITECSTLINDKVESTPIKKPKIDIWKKRTVGEVFDVALQRYYERKALREL